MAYAAGGNGPGADLFPELRNAWTAGPTVNGLNSLAVPSDAIAITDVTTNRAAGSPTWSVLREFPLNFVQQEQFANLTKDTTVSGYPSIWSKRGKSILYWPTTDSTTVAYLRYYGLKIETVLVNPTDSFFMNEIWHDFVAMLAAQMLAKKLGWYEQADALWTQFKDDLAATLNVTSMEEHPFALGVQDAPTRYSVNGR